jgi:hypothetical protein
MPMIQTISELAGWRSALVAEYPNRDTKPVPIAE